MTVNASPKYGSLIITASRLLHPGLRLIWLDAKDLSLRYLTGKIHPLSTEATEPIALPELVYLYTSHTTHNVDNHAHPAEYSQDRHKRICPPNAIHWGYQSRHLHCNGQIRQQILREPRTRATSSVSPSRSSSFDSCWR